MLRILSLNLKNSLLPALFRRRADALKELIRTADPDLIGIQEYCSWMQPGLRELEEEYHFLTRSRGKDPRKGEGCGMLVRKERFSLSDSRVNWLSEEPPLAGSRLRGSLFPRTVMFARLSDGKEDFVFAVTHLDHLSERIRAKEADILACLLNEYRGEEECVLCGDFNAVSDAPSLSALRKKTGLKETLPALSSVTLRPVMGVRIGKGAIDHIFFSSGGALSCSVLDGKYGGRAPSDHCPLLCELDLFS